MILDQIDLSVVARKLKKSNFMRCPKGYRPETLIAALIAMQVEKIPTIKHPVKRLNEDPVFRYSCGLKYSAAYLLSQHSQGFQTSSLTLNASMIFSMSLCPKLKI